MDRIAVPWKDNDRAGDPSHCYWSCGVNRMFNKEVAMNLPIVSDFKYRGMRCVVLALDMGHRCGYVHIPTRHKLYRKNYDDVNIQVHGGLTFSDFLQPGRWFIGFDCAHCDDKRDPSIMDESALKAYNSYSKEWNDRGTLRTTKFCEDECRKMVDQIRAMEAL